ncbi:hypothetical protein ACA910_004203 [Epithemia clementina (nom. ined.)]
MVVPLPSYTLAAAPFLLLSTTTINTRRAVFRVSAVVVTALSSVPLFLLSGTTGGVMSMAIPSSRMELSESMREAVSQNILSSAKLIPLDIRRPDGNATTSVVERTDATISLQQAAVKHGGTPNSGSIAFVVRRPGCVLCREHGQQLSEFAAEQGKGGGPTFGFWGIVKETGVDDVGLSEFYQQHYTFPLYRDVDKVTYQALGNRKISLPTWNPFRLWKGYRTLSQRLAQKQLQGNLVGEGMVQGGVFVFDAQGTLRYAYPEETGVPLELEDLKAAMQQMAAVPTTALNDKDSKIEL